MATTTALRKEVLGLYRACMRSARKCPEWEQREMMKTYVRMSFRDEGHTRDTSRIKRLLADAREQLERMEYYHSVFEEKQRQRVAATDHNATIGSAVTTVVAPTAEAFTSSNSFIHARCPGCGSDYVPPTAKFCSSCGVKRV